MTAETLSMLAGAVLSLGFSYLPGLSSWFAGLGEGSDGGDGGTRKRLVMLGLLLLAASGAFALACSGWGPAFGLTLACDQSGLAGLARALVLAMMANQSAYQLSPKTGQNTARRSQPEVAHGG